MTFRILDTLRGARGLIYDSDHWLQEIMARDAIGDCVDPADMNACEFCAVGAIYASCWNADLGHDGERVLDALRDFLPREYRSRDCDSENAIFAFNDNAATTHAEVVKVFDAAIDELAICEAEAEAESCGGIV